MKRRLVVALAMAVLTAQLSVPLVGAKGPAAEPPVGGGEPQGDSTVLPLTAAQKASRVQKEAVIAAIGDGGGGGGGRTTMACPVPTGAEATSAAGTTLSAESVVTQAATCGPTPIQFTLSASPRQQAKSYFCGPAVVQVVSNSTWGFSATNKYSQQAISDTWTRTDANLQTFLADFINGMNGASRLPSGFAYMQKHSPTFADWHTTIVGGIYNWRMPLAASVRPHEPGAFYYIISWPVAKSAAHYIGLFGYRGFASTANLDRKVYYTDTAGTYAASGVKAGNFWDISYDIYQTMMMNNQNMVY
jgi:hypothetical protein